jgi:hypothetical protein
MNNELQIGLDLATSLSIIGAAIMFFIQLMNRKKNELKSELWHITKELLDDLNKSKIEIVNKLIDGYDSMDKESAVEIIDWVYKKSLKVEKYVSLHYKVQIDNFAEFYDLPQENKAKIAGNFEDLKNDLYKYQEMLYNFRKGVQASDLCIDDFRGELTNLFLAENSNGEIRPFPVVVNDFTSGLLSDVQTLGK